MLFAVFFMLLVSTFVHPAAAVYNLAQDYSGSTFFQGWDFFTAPDPTSGHVLYQSQADATSQGLIKFQTANSFNNTNQVYIGVDSTNQAPNGRSSVRISTQQTFQHALVLADIAHQPGGICGVWPAFWMVGSNWPQNGEIDIVEGVSTQPTNQMTLHTSAGPILSQTSPFSGTLLTPNCDVDAPNQPQNAGCGIADDSQLTFGNNFNSIGGGVFATEWTSQFIKIWFFPRDRIPADIQSGNPVPSQAWGTPNSLFQGPFSMDNHFKDLSIVMNTAFCGDWAGAVWTSTPECAALAPTCDEYVTSNPQAFEQAFWLINSVKVFQDNGAAAASPTTAGVPTATVPSTTTITQTFTVQPTSTLVPLSSVNITSQPDYRGPHASSGVRTPGMVFDANEKRRSGGAVLPVRVLRSRRAAMLGQDVQVS